MNASFWERAKRAILVKSILFGYTREMDNLEVALMKNRVFHCFVTFWFHKIDYFGPISISFVTTTFPLKWSYKKKLKYSDPVTLLVIQRETHI